MAIRKDIDDMLNNLKGGKPLNTPKPAPRPNVRRDSKIDNMSVDDLLSSITVDKKTTQPAAAPAPEAEIAEEAPAVSEPVPASKKVVITGELPDYEALRAAEKKREQEERERIESERSAAEKAERARIIAEKARLEAERKLEEDKKAARMEAEKRAAEAMKAARIEAQRRAAEDSAKKEQEERAALEAARLEVERKSAEEAARVEAQRRAAEEAARIEAKRIADEEAARRAAEEAARIEAEKSAAEEAARIETERRAADEASRIEAERRAAEEAARIESERRAAEEAARIESERRAAEEAARIEAERRAAEEAARIEAERRAAEEEAERIAAEEREREEAELEARIRAAAEAEAARLEAERIENEKKAAELEKAQEAPAEETPVPETAPVEESAEEKAPEEKKSFFKLKRNEDGELIDNIEPTEEAPKKPGKLTSALKNILDEDPDEIINSRREQAEPDGEGAVARGGFKKGLYTVLGIIFAILACVGLITVIAKGVEKVTSYTSGDTRKDALENVLYPAVIMDIESFADPTELPSDQVITAAIWSMIMTDGVTDNYEQKFDVVIIPAVDVESYAVKLFGDSLPALNHTTVGPAGSKFYYNEETKSYNVPAAPVTYTYAPEIREATKNGSDYTVIVDYIDELPSWLPKISSKSVEFKVVETNDGYQLRSMRILSTSTNSV